MKILPRFIALAPVRSIPMALCLLVGVCAESACSRSAPSELKATLKTWNAEAETKTVDDAMHWYQASTDDEKKLARSFATEAIATARLSKAAREKWGHDAETVIAHLCSTDTLDDDNTATVTGFGDHVTVKLAASEVAPIHLVKSNGVWRVNVASYIRIIGPKLQSAMKYSDQFSAMADKTTAAIIAGKYASSQDAADAVRAAIAGLDAEQ